MEYTKYLNKNWKEHDSFNQNLNSAVEQKILEKKYSSEENSFYDGGGFTLRVREDFNFTEINLIGRNLEKGKNLLSKLSKNNLN